MIEADVIRARAWRIALMKLRMRFPQRYFSQRFPRLTVVLSQELHPEGIKRPVVAKRP